MIVVVVIIDGGYDGDGGDVGDVGDGGDGESRFPHAMDVRGCVLGGKRGKWGC